LGYNLVIGSPLFNRNGLRHTTYFGDGGIKPVGSIMKMEMYRRLGGILGRWKGYPIFIVTGLATLKIIPIILFPRVILLFYIGIGYCYPCSCRVRLLIKGNRVILNLKGFERGSEYVFARFFIVSTETVYPVELEIAVAPWVKKSFNQGSST
jgi:hypothetical protein